MQRRAALTDGKRTGAAPARSLLLAGFVLANTVWAAAAFGAASPVAACDPDSDLQSLDVSATELTSVASVAIEPASDADPARIAEPAAPSRRMPVLDLTPRLRSILQSVFSTAVVEAAQPIAGEQATASLGESASLDAATPVSPTDETGATRTHTGNLSNLQRQMYRTDI